MKEKVLHSGPFCGDFFDEEGAGGEDQVMRLWAAPKLCPKLENLEVAAPQGHQPHCGALLAHFWSGSFFGGAHLARGGRGQGKVRAIPLLWRFSVLLGLSLAILPLLPAPLPFALGYQLLLVFLLALCAL